MNSQTTKIQLHPESKPSALETIMRITAYGLSPVAMIYLYGAIAVKFWS